MASNLELKPTGYYAVETVKEFYRLFWYNLRPI